VAELRPIAIDVLMSSTACSPKNTSPPRVTGPILDPAGLCPVAEEDRLPAGSPFPAPSESDRSHLCRERITTRADLRAQRPQIEAGTGANRRKMDTGFDRSRFLTIQKPDIGEAPQIGFSEAFQRPMISTRAIERRTRRGKPRR